MSKANNSREITPGRVKDQLDRSGIETGLNSDNAFSDKGLNNAEKTRSAAKKGRGF